MAFSFKMKHLKFTLLLIVISATFEIISAEADDNQCPPVKLKRQWSGKAAKEIVYQVPPIQYAIVHHTATKECKNFVACAEILQNMQYFHMNKLQYDDIGYNFIIGNDGFVYEGRGWSVQGAHTKGHNGNSTGIAFIGNFTTKLPSRSALKAAKQLLACGVELGDLSKHYRLIGATQVAGTRSPGITLYNEIQEWNHWVLNP